MKAFLKLLKVNSAEKKDLFGSEGQKVTLQVAGVKIPREREQQVIKLRLPHCPLPPTMDVCLFVKDLEKGIKVDHEDTVRHFTDLLAEKGVKGVTQVRFRKRMSGLVIVYPQTSGHLTAGAEGGVQAV